MEDNQQTLFGSMPKRLTVEEMAEAFEISVSGLYKWQSEGFPLQGSLRDQVHWIRLNRPLVSDESLSQARLEKVRVETELKRLQFMVEKGRLIARDTVLKEFADRILIIKSGLVNFHRVIQSRMMGRDIGELGEVVKIEALSLLEKYSRKGGLLKKENE